jgi:hypothetical protein
MLGFHFTLFFLLLLLLFFAAYNHNNSHIHRNLSIFSSTWLEDEWWQTQVPRGWGPASCLGLFKKNAI